MSQIHRRHAALAELALDAVAIGEGAVEPGSGVAQRGIRSSGVELKYTPEVRGVANAANVCGVRAAGGRGVRAADVRAGSNQLRPRTTACPGERYHSDAVRRPGDRAGRVYDGGSMNTEVRRKLEMAARVREFVRSHSSTESSYGPVLARLEERLTRAETIAARQHAGRVAAKGARARRKELRHILHFQLLRYLTAVGSVMAKDRAELAAKFKLPSGNATNSSFVTSVKSLIAVAEGQKELLVQEGMSETLLDELGKMVAEFEIILEAVRTARREHIGARVDLGVITVELQKVVKVLDGITRYRFGMNPEMMAEWGAVKQVLGRSARGRVTPEAGGSSTPGGIAPAA